MLNKRNAQVAKFITDVATLVHSTEHDDVTNESTSLEWIFSYLQRYYGIEIKGANFMKFSEHVSKKGLLTRHSINNTEPPSLTT